VPLARSRYRGGIGSIRGVEIGQGTFSSTATPTCPPGQHWEAPAAAAVRGIGACVPNAVSIRPLTFRPATPAPAPNAPLLNVVPLTLPGASLPAPAPAVVPTAATGPTEATAAPAAGTCPALWPWWWILVAGVVGLGAGYYAEQNQKKVKKNAGRYANRIVNRAGDVALARLLG